MFDQQQQDNVLNILDVQALKMLKVMYVALIGLQFMERIYIGPNEDCGSVLLAFHVGMDQYLLIPFLHTAMSLQCSEFSGCICRSI